MNNSQENKKLNDKGFSLVELIIVIAIMAVLVGVLAPQYLQYVERSRESADLDSYDSILSALEIYAADPANVTTTQTSSSTTFAKGTAKQFLTTSTEWIEKALAEAGISSATMKSTKYGDITITSSVGTDGYVKFTLSVPSGKSSNATDLVAALGVGYVEAGTTN